MSMALTWNACHETNFLLARSSAMKCWRYGSEGPGRRREGGVCMGDICNKGLTSNVLYIPQFDTNKLRNLHISNVFSKWLCLQELYPCMSWDSLQKWINIFIYGHRLISICGFLHRIDSFSLTVNNLQAFFMLRLLLTQEFLESIDCSGWESLSGVRLALGDVLFLT